MSTAQNAVTAEPSNGSATIRARVGASAIDKVTRLFSAGLADIFTETLQNSRRGGANRVAATIEQDGDTTRVTLADDGVGIADPAVLLTFGESAWKDGIAEAEDPAGFGLLALSRRGCTLRWRVPGQDPSPGCRLVLEPAHFLGRDAAHVVPDDSAPWPHGTAVTFEASEAPHSVRAFLETAARHYPLPVTIDGEVVERRAFLDGALHVEPWKGLVFGVFEDSHAGYRVPDVNFHGLTLPVRLPQIDAVEGGVWSARADIDSCPDLELVLPARKEAVETPFLEEMREAARLAVYRAMAQTDPAPRVAWTDWHKAKEAGIEMPEPPAELRPWRPAIADTDYWNERSAFAGVGTDGLVMQADPEPPEAQALHRALGLTGLRGGSKPALQLFASEPRFEGYPWYDALARVTGIETLVTVDGAVRSLDSFLDRENGGEPERPETIVMHLNVLHPPKSSRHCFRKCGTIAVPADLAFAGEAWSSVHDALPLVTADSDIAPEELARLLRAAFFSPSDDADADSWETQLTRFEETALHMSLKLMCSVEEDKRWAADLYGKSRNHSAALRQGLCDTLVLLAVHGNAFVGERLGVDLEAAVNDVVHRLLAPSAEATWLSQQNDLPQYAEAAPDTFLSIVEADLNSEDPKIAALFVPADTGIFGNCPRSGMLWALEMLAWKPERLTRITSVLAKLCAWKIDDNWANKPMGTLESIFRFWMPQTAATVDQRNRALETLTKKFPDAGWQACVDQFNPASRVGHFSSKPRWRTDAYDAGEVTTVGEGRQGQRKAVELALDWPAHDEHTLGDLVERLEALSPEHRNWVCATHQC